MLDRAIWKNESESVSKYFKPTTGWQRWELRGGCRVSLLLYVVDEYKIKLTTQTFFSGYFWAKQMTPKLIYHWLWKNILQTRFCICYILICCVCRFLVCYEIAIWCSLLLYLSSVNIPFRTSWFGLKYESA